MNNSEIPKPGAKATAGRVEAGSLLCYRCGSHVPESSESCPACGQKLTTGQVRQATGTFSRRKSGQMSVEGAPYQPQQMVAGRYLIKDVIGAGPTGHVFRAHDREIDVEVALKVINPKLVQTATERQHFSQVIRAARKLSHPNVVRVYDDGLDNERPYFTSQFLDGLSLRKIIDLRLNKGQFFAPREIEPIIGQLAGALDAAHKVGAHGDVKPENVLVLPDLLKMTDFGLGLAIPRLPFVQAMKARKADRYLSPEMLEGSEVDGATDIYSLGVIIGEMLSGLLPDGAIPELSRRNPDVPHQLEALYNRCLNTNPKSRFPTGAALHAELLAVVKSIAPPPKSRVEQASGAPTLPRPRTQTGMLQLAPRKTQVAPPPPPPVSVEMPAVQPPAMPGRPAPRRSGIAIPVQDARADESAEMVASAEFIPADPDDLAETRIKEEIVAPPPDEPAVAHREPEERSNARWLILLALFGIALGGVGGYVMKVMHRAPAKVDDTRTADDEARRALEQQKLEARQRDEERARAEAEAKARAEQAARDEQARKDEAAKKEAERLEAEKRAVAPKQDTEASDRAAAERREAARAKEKADELARLEREKAFAKEVGGKESVVASAGTDKVDNAVPTGPCPEGMRLVEKGAYRAGTPKDDPMMGFDERLLSSIEVGTYCIDTYEYPNKKGIAPAINVTWPDARRLCEARGKRLCSEDEWEKACKGTSAARWPYGDSFDGAACNAADDSEETRAMAPSGKFAKCKSPLGVYDLSGNVAEWTENKVQKGGSFSKGDFAVRCSARKPQGPSAKSGEVGFRCCADAR